MAWIELHQTLREHKKMFACADDLGVKRTEMIGILVSLWLWALDNAQDGSLVGVSDKTIARVCDFPEKKAGKLVEVLRKNRFLDKEGDHYVIHNWYNYAGKLMEKREKDRARKQKGNKNSKDLSGNSDSSTAEETQDFHRNSIGNPMDEPGNSRATVPNHTVPYPTNTFTGGDGRDAGAREADSELLARVGLKPGEYGAVTVEAIDRAIRHARSLFARYLHREPEPWDCKKVFVRAFDADSAGLLEYAFETAAVAGKSGNWPYIEGILDNLAVRGIHSVAQAKAWDEERPDKYGEDAP